MIINSDAIHKQLYLNRAQIKSFLIGAHIEVDIWGRGTGKSEGLIAPRVRTNTFRMPRSKGIMIGPTYQHLLVNTLPNVIEMWKRMGYHRDYHYFIGRRPPEKWKWPLPYNAPLSAKHAIFWFNGSCQVLVSQDRVENAAGPSVDYIIGDEAKHLNYNKLQETFQTNRGNRQYFGHLSEHHSMLFCTDMPTSPKSDWLFEYEKEMDTEAVKLILALQREIIKQENKFLKASQRTRKDIQTKLNRYYRHLNDLRMDLVYYSEFSTLENIEIVGEDFIRQQRRSLTPMKYRVSILNERIKKIEGGFYPNLNEDKHYYTSFNYDALDKLKFDFSQIKQQQYSFDSDVQRDQPLDIAMDYNAAINSLAVGQEFGSSYRTLNFLYVLSPKLLKDVVKKFCNYYKDHPTKEVNYYYDHTAIGTTAKDAVSFSEEVIHQLTQHKWTVNEFYVGKAPNHAYKYNTINLALQGDRSFPDLQFNRNNCQSLLISMENADCKQGPSGFEKDKSSEKDPIIKPQHATHPSDAWDTLFYGRYGDVLTHTQSLPSAEII